MTESSLFAAALGLLPPWFVVRTEFSREKRQLDIFIDFEKGALFTCPACGGTGKAYDTAEESWRHLNFFQHSAFLHARVPRIDCGNCKSVKKVDVPWARPGSGFTLLFEALVMAMAREMPVLAIAKMIGEHDTRLWRVIRHYVVESLKKRDLSGVRFVGVDETSRRKGHQYVSLFFDLETRQLIFATAGKDSDTLKQCAVALKEHGGSADNIQRVCCDLSPAFIKGVAENFSQAEVTFDRFHLTKIVNDAVDKVRREEAATCGVLKATRYLWLRNPKGLTRKQRSCMNNLSLLNLKTVRAYHIRLNFQELFSQPSRQSGETFLKAWYWWATHSRLKPMVDAAKTIKRHWDGVLSWFDSKINNGLLEGINSLIQAAKCRARGYRSVENFIAMAYLIAGNLHFGLPT